MLADDGVYICEDVHTSYWRTHQGGLRQPGTFIEYCKHLIDRLHAWYVDPSTQESNESFARMTWSICFYDSMVVIEKRRKEDPFHSTVGRIELDKG